MVVPLGDWSKTWRLLLQFLFEAVMISLAGSLIGTVVASLALISTANSMTRWSS
jgi:ABC-type antimicrobial peptide transport system permease subunit